ncbi:MAG: hypothetical protein WCM76_15065 [Bacteroidota bacterium]
MYNAPQKNSDSAFAWGCLMFVVVPAVLIGIIEIVGFPNRQYWQIGVLAILAIAGVVAAYRRYRSNLRRKRQGEWTSLHE